MTATRTDITSEEQWQALREPNIGASEIGALFGEHDYCTAYSLSARKLGLLESEPDSDILRRGRLLEPVAIELLREERPDWEVSQPRAYYCDVEARLGATPDCFVREQPDGRGVQGVVQIKSVEPSVFARAWHNEDGEVVAPYWIQLQVMLEAHLTGSSFAYVAALVVGHGIHLELIEVIIDPRVVTRMYERASLFWHQVDAGKTLDPDYGRDADALAAVHREDNGAELDMSHDNELPTIAARLEAHQAAKKISEDAIDECKARILHRIGDAAKVKFAGGMISAKTVHRKEHVVPASSYRRLSVRMSRGEIVP